MQTPTARNCRLPAAFSQLTEPLHVAAIRGPDSNRQATLSPPMLSIEHSVGPIVQIHHSSCLTDRSGVRPRQDQRGRTRTSVGGPAPLRGWMVEELSELAESERPRRITAEDWQASIAAMTRRSTRPRCASCRARNAAEPICRLRCGDPAITPAGTRPAAPPRPQSDRRSPRPAARRHAAPHRHCPDCPATAVFRRRSGEASRPPAPTAPP